MVQSNMNIHNLNASVSGDDELVPKTARLKTPQEEEDNFFSFIEYFYPKKKFKKIELLMSLLSITKTKLAIPLKNILWRSIIGLKRKLLQIKITHF